MAWLPQAGQNDQGRLYKSGSASELPPTEPIQSGGKYVYNVTVPEDLDGAEVALLIVPRSAYDQGFTQPQELKDQNVVGDWSADVGPGGKVRVEFTFTPRAGFQPGEVRVGVIDDTDTGHGGLYARAD